ncbi:unnamed protein product [Aphanomyces euteiches]
MTKSTSLFKWIMARYMDFVVSYRFIVLVLVVLFLVVGYFDVATVDLVVDHHLALVHDKVAYFSKGSHDYYRRQPSVYDEVCRVQFIFAGSKHDYNNFPTLQSWIRFADPKCPIEFLRTNHPFVGVLTTAEARMFHDSAFLPILQADMLKFFAVYYLGGLVVDLDVQAIKPFPEAWIGKDSPHSSCDVILGIEANCYDDECVKTMVRKGQVPNWAMFVRRPRSQFLGDLLDFVVAKYESMAPLDKDAAVQEVAGSGTITDFVQQYGNFTTPHYQRPADTKTPRGNLHRWGILHWWRVLEPAPVFAFPSFRRILAASSLDLCH